MITTNRRAIYTKTLLREVEEPAISTVLRATKGNQIRAAQILGLNRNTLRKKIKDLDISILKGL